jgi:hypothetical protein
MTMKTLSAVLLLCAFTGCSSEETRAPSRPPTSPPITNTDGGTDGSTPTCFDTTKEKPTQPDHFLNQCNSGECSTFDNATRIEGFKPGQALPPLN